MTIKKIFAATLTMFLLSVPAAVAQQSILSDVNAKCASEIKTHCKGVSLGEGRLAACLYAYEDKLSTQCAVAVYKGVEDLWAANANLQVYAKQCSADLLQYCAKVRAGDGRLYECIKKKKATLTDACRDALNKAEPDMKRLGLAH